MYTGKPIEVSTLLMSICPDFDLIIKAFDKPLLLLLGLRESAWQLGLRL